MQTAEGPKTSSQEATLAAESLKVLWDVALRGTGTRPQADLHKVSLVSNLRLFQAHCFGSVEVRHAPTHLIQSDLGWEEEREGYMMLVVRSALMSVGLKYEGASGVRTPSSPVAVVRCGREPGITAAVVGFRPEAVWSVVEENPGVPVDVESNLLKCTFNQLAKSQLLATAGPNDLSDHCHSLPCLLAFFFSSSWPSSVLCLAPSGLTSPTPCLPL